MSSSTANHLTYISQQITIYFGCFVVIMGIFGGVLSIVVLVSLKTFRETSCAFYLTVASVAAVCQLLNTSLSRILVSGFTIDPTISSLFYCKFRSYLSQAFNLIFLTCMCLCSIDQFLSIIQRWRHFCTLSFASRLVLIISIGWFIHGIPYMFFFEITKSSSNALVVYIHPAEFSYLLSSFLPSCFNRFSTYLNSDYFWAISFFSYSSTSQSSNPFHST